MILHNRLALGTVQFGLNYGVANKTGKVSCDEAAAIIKKAFAAGIDTLDTAISYGESEILLGKIGLERWRIVTKLPPMPDNCTHIAGWVQESVMGSLARLKINRLRGLLLHNSQQLLKPQGEEIYREMVLLRTQGLTEKIGVSIYSPEELEYLWPHFQFDLVQAPLNVIDRRLITSGWLAKLHKVGVEIHVRSVFLQGLLLMERAKRPAIFNRWRPLWQQWHRWIEEQSLTPLTVCLNFVKSYSEIDRIVIGVDNLNQLQEILAKNKGQFSLPPVTLMSEDLDLIDPSRWNQS